jgi:hypothetical protein
VAEVETADKPLEALLDQRVSRASLQKIRDALEQRLDPIALDDADWWGAKMELSIVNGALALQEAVPDRVAAGGN